MRWLGYLGLILAGLYGYLTFDSYQESAWSFETIVNAFCTIAWIGITYTNINNALGVEEITLSRDNVTFVENKEQKSIRWDEITSINMTNNALFLNLCDEIQKELNIGYLGYKQLQEAKKQMRLFSEKYQIDFSSKY